MLRSYLLSLFLLMAANSLLAVNSLNLYLQLPDQGWSTEGVHQTDEGNRLYASKLWRFLF